MNLNNFESYIDKKILARGYDYYENDYVISVEETEDNIYEAEVKVLSCTLWKLNLMIRRT